MASIMKWLTGLWRILSSPVRLLMFVMSPFIRPVAGFDLDPVPGEAKLASGVPFGEKEGYGVFTALAGFALAQATALY